MLILIVCFNSTPVNATLVNRLPIDVITDGKQRRRWSIEEKREIVTESGNALGLTSGPSEIIRKHGITSGQLYAWRQQLTGRVAEPLVRVSASFARVEAATGERKVRVPKTPAMTMFPGDHRQQRRLSRRPPRVCHVPCYPARSMAYPPTARCRLPRRHVDPVCAKSSQRVIS
jgi:transposase-like protein